MLKLISIFVYLGLTVSVNAQLRYKDLDQYSQKISEIQYRTIQVGASGGKFTFAPQNFMVLIPSKLVNTGYYTEDASGDNFYFFEGVDLAKTKSIYYDQNSADGLQKVTVELDYNPTVTMVRKEGTRTGRMANLRFFFPKGNETDKKLLFDNLVALTYLLKKYAGNSDSNKIASEMRTWKRACDINSPKEYRDFAAIFPESILAQEAKNRIESSDPSYKGIKYFFDAYKAGYGRPKKYLSLWGNWKPGKNLSDYAGESTSLKSEYRVPGFKAGSFPDKINYHNTGILFEINTKFLSVYENNTAAKKDELILPDGRLFPEAIRLNENNEVILLQYKIISKGSIVSNISNYLGYPVDLIKEYDVKQYIWYFDDCSVLYQEGGKREPDRLYLVYHDKSKMIPADNFTYPYENRTIELTPEIWKKWMNIK